MFSIIQAAGWPIWPLLASSVVVLAIIIERFMTLRVARIAPAHLVDEVISLSTKSVPTPEVISQLEQNSELGSVLASGLRLMQSAPQSTDDDLRAALEGAGRLAAQRMEAHLTALATIATAAPLLGLLGTVVGMIEIFGSQSPGGATAGNPAQLAHGISIALYNTAFGLIVAIPALVFWRFFRSRVDSFLLTLELGAERLLRHLKTLSV